MEVRYLGHASLGINIGEYSIIIDPFISGNPLAKDKIDVNKLKADYIFITHAHGDHIQDVELLAKNNPKAMLVSNPEIIGYYAKKGLTGHELNHGGSITLDFGRVKYVNAIHSSAFPDGIYGGNPGGFVLEANEKTVYIAGDTALTYDMKLISEAFKLDLAILPIGDNYTMGPKDAAKAAEFLSVERVLGYHYDSFPIITIDHKKAKEAFQNKKKELILLNIGETISV